MSVPRILVIDDEPDLRELVEITLLKMGLDVDSADRLATARALLQQHEYALVLTDMRLPDGMGIELVREVTGACRNTPIAVITAFGSADNAVTALKAGAFDYLSKPVGLDQLRLLVQSALRISTVAGGGGKAPAVAGGGISLRLMGQSSLMQDLRTQIARLARSMAPIAITGESGSGKELAARDIHAQSARADKAFIAVNCGAIPESLMEAEFFGYRKGAFTGAAEDRDGFFQAANGGTLLLDEVADLPLAMQVKLLRAIQERRVRKVGATVEEPVDVRLISATHQDLAECVEKGKFRQDLYYRLNVIELRLPSLRERLEDVGLLAETILAKLAGPGMARVTLAPAALAALRGYSFPGNVRELENILERAMAFANDDVIEVADLALKAAGMVPSGLAAAAPAAAPEVAEPMLQSAESTFAGDAPADTVSVRFHMPPTPDVAEPLGAAVAELPPLPASLPDHLDQVEREIICRALAQTRFNRTQAAELLGISFRQLRYRMQRLSIHEPE
ncbi:sigma-54 dependent transcriptional regulator [Janthinobacterium sp. 17J80-10]|uniref:sigma-54-dependent transcriptional regulator n=1 Tax=Janthinobacterium sp. 17J80-10 TaxID=2497863 RepID=UPI00100532A9|nr:sigma-54 dependent transcriptional regulator [Janthinobacterium sp. 17J80-10]QAU33518.1 sigma-54-dependent Fis family transcriptional regulator [Janthinobacterium sp. 17J80-10]